MPVMAFASCGRHCVSLPSFVGRRGGVIVRHGQKNSWLMNYTLEELFFSAKGGAMVMGSGAGNKGAASMREADVLVYHDNKTAKMNKYALPGINVPTHIVKYPKELSDEELDRAQAKVEPRVEKDVQVIDIDSPDELRRYKWLNRFGTHMLPGTRMPRIVGKSIPTYYPGSRPVEQTKEVMLARKGFGFTGGIRAGQTMGPPINKLVSPDIADDFQSVLLDLRRVSHSRPQGHRKDFRAIVAIGNGNGLVGYESARGGTNRIAARKARNKAILRLYHVELCDNHTIFRNMDVRRGRTRMLFHRRETGYGVRCHRVARAICRLAGVKDVHAKIRGSTNTLSVVGCTLKGLTGQLNHQEFADETGKHVVEMRREYGYRPIVLASPKSSGKKPSPLLKMTKRPYTGVVPLPYDHHLRMWYAAQQHADRALEMKGKEIIDAHIAAGNEC